MRTVPLLASICISFALLSGCAFSTVKAGRALIPDYRRETISTLVVGDFKSAKLSEEQRRKLVQEIKGKLQKEAVFVQVVEKLPLDGNDDQAIVLNGEVVEFEEGNRILQALVGLGAGASKVAVGFHIVAADGRPISNFSARRVYAGGAGIGGVSFVSMEGLIERLAGDIAETLAKWKRGEPVGDEALETPGTSR